jgi:hypothetical protein
VSSDPSQTRRRASGAQRAARAPSRLFCLSAFWRNRRNDHE